MNKLMAILYILFTDQFLEKTSQGWISRGYARKKERLRKGCKTVAFQRHCIHYCYRGHTKSGR